MPGAGVYVIFVSLAAKPYRRPDSADTVSFQDPLCNKDAWCGRRCPPAECLRGVLVRACAGACADQTRAYLAQGWFAACCLERGLLYYSMPADCRRVPLCGASPAQAFYTVVPLGRGLCVTMGAA